VVSGYSLELHLAQVPPWFYQICVVAAHILADTLYRNTFSCFYSKASLAMPKQKTSIVIEKDLWTEWIQFVVARTGSARRLSEEIEQALRYYMLHAKKKRLTV